MSLNTKKLLHLKPTYELVISKVLFSLGHSVAIVGIPLYFIEIGLTDSKIGIFTGLIALLLAVLSLYLPPLLERFNQRKLLILGSFLASTSMILFGFAGTAIIAMFCLALAEISLHINCSAFSVLFKDSTRTKQEFTKDTGFLGSFTNLGYFLGPLLGGLTLSVTGFRGVFIMSSFLTLLGGLYILTFPFKTVVKKRMQLDTKIFANLRFYLSNPQLRIAYLQKLGIDIWWGFIWTFIPIFMLKGNYSNSAIGLFIAMTQLPLFLLEYKTVNAISKYGFRRIFILSYACLATICLLSFYFHASNFSVALGLILVGSLALSFLEPISDVFFFSKISILDEEKTYPTYATSSPIGSMIAKIIPGLALTVVFDTAIFIVIGVMMSFIAYRAIYIKN